jgi:nucleotide-binding universal stress UspA family protein
MKIVGTAAERKCDLIVVGALGHSMLERMFGSTSDFVATHAKCSVLVVRPTGLKSTNRPLNICIAYDDTESSKGIFEQLTQFVWRANTKIDMVSVAVLPFNYSDLPMPFDFNEMIEARQKHLEAEANRHHELSNSIDTHVVEENHVGDGLVQFVKQLHSDIIVLGSTHSSVLSAFFVGSVSKYVLRLAKCSVWIARSKVANGTAGSVGIPTP